MTEDPRLDDDISAAQVTQGGRGRRGRSIWWVLVAAVLAVAALTFAFSIHKTAPAERGTTPVAGSAHIPSPTAAAPRP